MANPLIQTLKELRGNPRACIYTEPLWGLSLNLCLPYASVYMIALGLADAQIGLVATVYMLSQVVFAFLGGPVTDKLGRRNATAIFDFVAWCIPCLIWMRAEGFWFFFAAALCNGAMKVPVNSWDCLLIEDADKSQITRLYSLVMACAQLSALFAPISSILVSRLTLVPAIRILYINAFVVMTIKITVLYCMSRETQIGIIRRRETKGKSIFALAWGYGGVLRIMGRSRGMVFALVIVILMQSVGMINNTFWQVIVTQKLAVGDALLPFFFMFRSCLALVFYFTLIQRLTRSGLKIPLIAGFVSYLAGQCILIFISPQSDFRYGILLVSLLFDSFGAGILAMLTESLVALHVNRAERARSIALLHIIIMLVISPFGWIAGLLSGISRTLPFVLSSALLLAGFVITLIFYPNYGTPKDNQ